MDLETFQNSLKQEKPPSLDHPLLLALWYDGKGDWQRAHDIAEDIGDANGAWVHAYLHRVEGDNWNANYWYRRAGRTMPKNALREEWTAMVTELLERG